MVGATHELNFVTIRGDALCACRFWVVMLRDTRAQSLAPTGLTATRPVNGAHFKALLDNRLDSPSSLKFLLQVMKGYYCWISQSTIRGRYPVIGDKHQAPSSLLQTLSVRISATILPYSLIGNIGSTMRSIYWGLPLNNLCWSLKSSIFSDSQRRSGNCNERQTDRMCQQRVQ